MEHYFVGSETTLYVNLANNKRIDTIPSSFKNMKSLQSLILDGNRIDKNGIPAVVLRQCERLSGTFVETESSHHRRVERVGRVDGVQRKTSFQSG